MSRNTASKALIMLKTEGLIVTQHGSGAYVREPYPIHRLGPDRYARSRWQQTSVEVFAAETPEGESAQREAPDAGCLPRRR